MSNTLKQIIALVITVVAVVAVYFGSYLPLKKSQLQIDAIASLRSGKIRSLQDFNDLFNPVLDFRSPVGQDEIISYYLGILMNIINQQSQKEVIDILVKQAEDRMAPILEAKKGFSFNQNLYSFGSLYKVAAIRLNDDFYYQKAIDIFEEGLKYSPNRPFFLMGLFEIYQQKGDIEKVKEIGEIILRYWPDNEKVRKILELIV